jgi:mRNA interferase HigB
MIMHVISRRPFNDAAKEHPNQRQALEDVYRVLRSSNFSSPDEMRQVFPSLDNFKHKDKWWVLDVGGNNLRVIAFIQFVHKRIYVKHILTHAEYDKICNRYTRGKL